MEPVCVICGNTPEGPHIQECLQAEAELLSSIREQEQAYQEVREERHEAAQAEHEAWREQRYAERLQKQEETNRIAREWRESQQEPDPDWVSWQETLKTLTLMGSGRFEEEGE